MPKGLAAETVGIFSDTILGIACIATGYALTFKIRMIVAAVGVECRSYLPEGSSRCFLTASAYCELNSDAPDCGASFT